MAQAAERPGRRQEESQRRRERILDAARECFGKHGFAGTKIEAIASEAGVSNGLLYQFFRNKEHLFRVVVADVIRDWARAFVPAEDEALSPGETLETIFRRSVAFCRSNPLLPAILTKDAVLELGRIGNPSGERLGAYRELVSSVLRDGIAAGEFRADLDVASVADVIVQLHVDYSTRAYRRDPQFPANPELIDATARFIQDAVKGVP